MRNFTHDELKQIISLADISLINLCSLIQLSTTIDLDKLANEGVYKLFLL